ncbi:MAG: hypothetical protein JXP73_13195 [Deltaproteobacteria bacterium]|nr:hypothetical protein [Deltaproteobacteria bacterium]
MMRKLWISMVALLALAGCGSGSGTPQTGEVCTYNSDCQAGLTCSFGRCLAACKTEADCPAGQQCVKNASGINVCLLPEVERCIYNSDCQAPLVCAADFKCRNQCQSDIDCATSTQKCVLPDHVCAEPSAIDPVTGRLKPPVGGLDGGTVDSAPIIPVQPDAALPDVPVVDAGSVDLPVATPDAQSVDVGVVDAPLGPDAAGPGPSDAAVCSLDAAALTLSGTISSNRILPYLPGCKYKAAGNISVSSSAILTVEPGVVIEFVSGVGLTVYGALSAAGTAELPIRFAGAQATPGYWEGIGFSNSDNVANVLDHVIIENAGTATTGYSGNQPASLTIDESRVQIKNTTIRGGSGVGLAMYAPSLDAFSGNVITGNALGAVSVYASYLGSLVGASPSSFAGNTVDQVIVTAATVSKAQTWPALDVPYRMSGNTTINTNVAIEAGARFRMAKDALLRVGGASASLSAKGVAGKEIVFSGDQATRGYWEGLHFDNSDNVNNLLDHVVIEHAGTAETGYSADLPGSLLVETSRVQIKNTIVRLGSGVGLVLYGPTLDAFAGNTFTQNTQGAASVYAHHLGQMVGDAPSSFAGNDVDYVLVNGYTVDTAQTWPILDVPYLLRSDVTVGAALTIAAGATLVFQQDVYMNVNSSGSLTAQGQAGAVITFTGELPQAGHWGGLWFSSSKKPNNILDYVTVSYGGGRETGSSSRFPANIYVYGSLVTVTNSTIAYSANYGIWWDANSTVTQSGNTFVGNLVDHP